MQRMPTNRRSIAPPVVSSHDETGSGMFKSDATTKERSPGIDFRAPVASLNKLEMSTGFPVSSVVSPFATRAFVMLSKSPAVSGSDTKVKNVWRVRGKGDATTTSMMSETTSVRGSVNTTANVPVSEVEGIEVKMRVTARSPMR